MPGTFKTEGVVLRSIRYGEADIMIAGGAESAGTELAVGGFASARALSTRNADPEGAAWFFKMTIADKAEFAALMTRAEYDEFVKGH